MKLLVVLLQAVLVTTFPLNAGSPPSEAQFDAVSEHASPLIPSKLPHHPESPSSLQTRDTHPPPTQQELTHVLAQLFAIQLQVAILLPTLVVTAPSRPNILDNLLGGLFGVLPTLSQAIDNLLPTLDNIITTADQILAIPFVYTIPALIPIVTTTTVNVPLSVIYSPFPTIGPSLTAELLALAQLTDPVAILDVVADLVASVLSPLLGGGGVLPVLVPVYPVLGAVTTVVTKTDGGVASTVTKVEALTTERVAPITNVIPGLLPGGARPTGLNVGVSAAVGGGPGGVAVGASVQLPVGLGLGLGVTVGLPNVVPAGRPATVTRAGPAASIALPTIPPLAIPTAPALPLPTLPPAVSIPSQPAPSTLPAVSLLRSLVIPDVALPTFPAVPFPSVALPSVAVPRVSLPPLAVPDIAPGTPPSVPVPGVSLPTLLPVPVPVPVPAVAVSLSLGLSVPSLAAAGAARISLSPAAEVAGDLEVAILPVPGRVLPTLPAIPTLPGVPTSPALPGLPPLPVPAVAVSLSLGLSVPSLAAAAPARISLAPVGEVAGELEVAITPGPGRVIPALPAGALPAVPTLPVVPALPGVSAVPGIPVSGPSLSLQQASVAPLGLPTLLGGAVPSGGLLDIGLPTLPAGLPGVSAPSLSLPLDVSDPTLPALSVELPTDLSGVSSPGLPSLTIPAGPDASGSTVPGISTGRPDGVMSPSTGSGTGLATAATLSQPTGQRPAGIPPSSTDSLDAGAVQATRPNLPRTSRPGEVVPQAGQSFDGVLRPTALPQNPLEQSGEAIQPTQPLGVPPPSGLLRESLAGALHATDAPRASIAYLPLSRPTGLHVIEGLPFPADAFYSGPSQSCTAQICAAQSLPCTQEPPQPISRTADVPHVPCTRRCVVNPAATVVPVPVQVLAADGPLHDDDPLPPNGNNKPLPLQDDKINANGAVPHPAPPATTTHAPVLPPVSNNLDSEHNSIDDLPVLPNTPNTPSTPHVIPAPAATGAAVVVVSASSSLSPPQFLLWFPRRPFASLLFPFGLVGVWAAAAGVGL